MARQGYSVAISADGTRALVGGFAGDVYAGAAWVLSNPANAIWVPVASHNGCKNHSQWRSDLGKASRHPCRS